VVEGGKVGLAKWLCTILSHTLSLYAKLCHLLNCLDVTCTIIALAE